MRLERQVETTLMPPLKYRAASGAKLLRLNACTRRRLGIAREQWCRDVSADRKAEGRRKGKKRQQLGCLWKKNEAPQKLGEG